ncbi:MAG: hypothetical protein ACLUZZ_05555 [Alistipes inops]
MQHRGEHTRNGRRQGANAPGFPAAPLFFSFPVGFRSPAAGGCRGQHRKISAAFYNVENLFDTISSPFRNDSDFTPSGAIAGTRNATRRNFPHRTDDRRRGLRYRGSPKWRAKGQYAI